MKLELRGVSKFFIRRIAVAHASQKQQDLRFEEEATPLLQGLGLYRDGVMSVVSTQATLEP